MPDKTETKPVEPKAPAKPEPVVLATYLRPEGDGSTTSVQFLNDGESLIRTANGEITNTEPLSDVSDRTLEGWTRREMAQGSKVVE